MMPDLAAGTAILLGIIAVIVAAALLSGGHGHIGLEPAALPTPSHRVEWVGFAGTDEMPESPSWAPSGVEWVSPVGARPGSTAAPAADHDQLDRQG